MKGWLPVLSLCVVLCSCVTKQFPPHPLPPPLPVNTESIQEHVQSSSRHVEQATTRVEVVTRTIKELIPVVDAETAKALESVQAELFRVSVELRDAKDQAAKAGEAVFAANTSIGELRVWGEARQQAEISNGEGWRKCASELDKEKLEGLKRQRHLLKLQSLIGLMAGVTFAIVGLKFCGPYGLVAGPVAWLAAYFL